MTIEPHMEQSIFYEVRAAHDAANWQRERYVNDGGAHWLIARIDPATDSGSATIPGGSINTETGALTVPKGAQTSLAKMGRWTRVDGSAPVEAGEYDWFEPLEEKRSPDPEDIYSPFVNGGVLLCAPDWEAEGLAQFGAPVLLFEDWVAAVPQAIGMAIPSEEDMADPSPELRDRLPQARTSANPLVAAWAWRQSLRLDSGDTPADLDGTSGPALTVRTRLVLDVGGDERTASVMQAIGATTDLTRLEAMATGAFSASQLPSASSGSSAHEALFAIGAQAHKLDPEGAANPRLRAILTVAGYAHQ